MDGREQDVVGRVEGVVGAVAVMDVPIDDEDPLGAVRRGRPPGCDRDVVEEAEAHRARRLGVVPRRAQRGDPASSLATEQGIDQRRRAAGGVQCRLERPRPRRGVHVDHPATRGAERLDEVHMVLGMDGVQELACRGRRLHGRKAEPVACLQRALEREHAFRAFGVVREPPSQGRLIAQRRLMPQPDGCAGGGRHLFGSAAEHRLECVGPAGVSDAVADQRVHPLCR